MIFADLSLRWVAMSYCWFCHDVAQILLPVHIRTAFAANWNQVISTSDWRPSWFSKHGYGVPVISIQLFYREVLCDQMNQKSQRNRIHLLGKSGFRSCNIFLVIFNIFYPVMTVNVWHHYELIKLHRGIILFGYLLHLGSREKEVFAWSGSGLGERTSSPHILNSWNNLEMPRIRQKTKRQTQI